MRIKLSRESDQCILATQEVELPKQAKQSSIPLSWLKTYLNFYEKQSSSKR